MQYTSKKARGSGLPIAAKLARSLAIRAGFFSQCSLGHIARQLEPIIPGEKSSKEHGNDFITRHVRRRRIT